MKKLTSKCQIPTDTIPNTKSSLWLAPLLGCWLLAGFSLPAVANGHDWPMWRYDAGRRASSPEELPAKMYLQWVRELPSPKPAWPESQDRLQFDASYEPVVAGQTIFVGSMVSDCVAAYDAQNGQEKWRFYTDGPVRFAPVVYKDKLYVACDDGYLYCLNAGDGSLVRRFLAGPSENKVLGNDRLIGMWPMRGGPVLLDGKIYFAAGIWPFMGTFIYAIDAETGDVVWENSGSASTFLMQPHTSPAFAGVAPQGYMVATEDKLLVSGGRSTPAAYDRRTGGFLYYRLKDYGKTGTCEVMASENCFFNRGAIHGLSDGYEIAKAPASVAAEDVFFSSRNNTIAAYRLDQGTKKAVESWRTELPTEIGKIHMKAGSRLYCTDKDQEGKILAVDMPLNDGPHGGISWQAQVDGEVWSMLAANGKLLVVTLQGSIYCFGDKRTEPKSHRLRTRALPDVTPAVKDKVRQILETTGEKEGYALLLGLSTGEFLYELLNQSELHIIALDPDSDKVAAVRRELDEAGLYGNRAAVHVGDIMTSQLPPYMANLVVAADLKAAGFRKDGDFIERIFRALRPYGGTACFLLPREEHGEAFKQVTNSELLNCTITSSDQLLCVTRSGPLPGSADWTHQYGDPANTVMSKDTLKAPLGLLWFGGPPNDKVLPRHGHGPSPQVVDGRLFIEGRNMLRAVDVYTGRLLWERQFQDLGKFYDNTSHQPGANEIGSNYVTVHDAVYVVYGETIHVLDPATGATTKEFSLDAEDKPNWGTILVWEDLLLATASPIHVPVRAKTEGQELPDDMQPIIEKGADWQYLAGSHPRRAWTQPDFDTKGWKTSAAGFGFGDDDDETVLRDMRNRYSVVYIRKSFSVSDVGNIREMGLAINCDDAFIAYLNGREILRAGVRKGSGARASDIESHEAEGYVYFCIENHGELLREGVNVLAIEGHNDDVDSSDFSLDPYLIARRNGGPEVDKKTAAPNWSDISGVTVNADYASGSKMLVAMNRHTGKILWTRDAEYSFRHNTIVMGTGKVLCIDGMSRAKLAFLKRRGISFEKEPTLYALDARTGQTQWKTNEGVFGTWLAYSGEHDVLLQAGSNSGDRAKDEADRGMAAYRGFDGEELWRNDDSYKGPPILYHDWAITQTGGGSGSAPAEAKVYSLLSGQTVMNEHPMTGETIPWTWVRFKGCNTAIASENLLTFRSASGAFVDLAAGQGTASIGGFKSGCTSNLIIANGVLNAPDYTRTCVCSYQNQASLALVHMPEVAYWTFDYYRNPSQPTPVKQVGINFGAPGNRYTENGTLWLEFPSVGGPSPDVPVRAAYENPRWFRYHNSRVEDKHNWLTASGVTGLREVRIRMFIQPGENPSAVDAFDKHIEKIPTWSEDQILGAFEQPRDYTVRLYFAETDELEAGRRTFDVSLQDKVVLNDFDIVKQAGRAKRTVIKEFKEIKIKDDLRIAFTGKTEDHGPLLCGIEIIAEDW